MGDISGGEGRRVEADGGFGGDYKGFGFYSAEGGGKSLGL